MKICYSSQPSPAQRCLTAVVICCLICHEANDSEGKFTTTHRPSSMEYSVEEEPQLPSLSSRTWQFLFSIHASMQLGFDIPVGEK